MAKRYSGTVTISIRYVDSTAHSPNGHYQCYLSSPRTMARRGYSVTVGAPRHLDHAVDSADAYDAVARAAVSFSGSISDSDRLKSTRSTYGRSHRENVEHEITECCDFDDDGVIIFRTAREVGAHHMDAMDRHDARVTRLVVRGALEHTAHELASVKRWSHDGSRTVLADGAPMFDVRHAGKSPHATDVLVRLVDSTGGGSLESALEDAAYRDE